MSRTRVYEWFKRFQDGRQNVQSDERSGRPVTSKTETNIADVRSAVRENRRITVRELSEDLHVSYGSVQSILTEDLGMRRVSAKFVPKLLSADEKENRLSAAQDLLDCAENDENFLKMVVTGDESWVYGYDPETKAQSSQWKTPTSPRPKKARMSRSNVKTLLTVFFDYKGIVHHEYAPPGQTVNKEYYREVLRRLRDAIRRKRPELHASGEWQFHHDNAPAHKAQLVQQFLAKHNIPQVQQPPYSPDLAPCDFFLFPKIKSHLKGRRFQDVEEIQANATRQMLAIPEKEFQACFQQWKQLDKACGFRR
jgi:transposase/AraC-like DNA-binding protein